MKGIRLIDANALKEKGIKWFIDERYYHPLDKPENMSESIFSSLIDNAPTVNLEKTSFMKGYNYGCDDGKRFYERPQGEWSITEETDEFYGRVYKCNQCGKEMLACGCRNYCTWCGADMKKEETE